MAGLTTIHTIGLAGLRTAQTGLNTTAGNISGASVEGFHRREVHPLIGSPTSDPLIQGGSVVIDNVVRSWSGLVSTQLLDNRSKLNQSATLFDSATVVDKMLVSESEGLTAVMNGFFSSAADLAADPASDAKRTSLAAASRALADRINTLAITIDETRVRAFSDMDRIATEANQKSEALARVNTLVQASSAFGKPLPSADLLDERDRIASELANLIGAKVEYSQKGEANVRFANGMSLVDGVQSFRLELAREGDANLPTGVLKVTTQPTKDQPSPMAIGSVKGGIDVLGEFGGLSRYADASRDWLARLGKVSTEMMMATSNSDPSALWRDKSGVPLVRELADGSEVPVAGAFFVDSEESVSEDRIPLLFRSSFASGASIPWSTAEARESGSYPVDQRIVQRFVAARDGTTNAWSNWVTTVSGEIGTWKAERASFEGVDNALTEKQQQISGVDMDEEATNLLKFQQIYQANGSVMQAAMRMFDVLMSLSNR
jgi:flagellar hook-associated protein 1